MSKNHRGTSISFFAFVQRLHQYASMKEIAEKLQEGLVKASELKDYAAAVNGIKLPDAKTLDDGELPF